MSWNSPVINIGAKSVERLCKCVRVDDWSTMKCFKLGGKVMNKEQLVEQTKTQFYFEILSSLNKSIQKHNNLMDCQPYIRHRFR